ncbi:MAG: dimethylarginine dimethylaminohydrolase family protein [Flammeovirgaceae bacterium]
MMQTFNSEVMAEEILLNVQNETASLEAVIVGIGIDEGTAHYQNNPKIMEHIEKGTYPPEEVLAGQVDNLASALEQEGVTVYRPANIPDVNQIFTRDIGFVIDGFFIKANMKRDNRKPEYDGIQHIIAQFPEDKILYPPKHATIEGGDVLLWGEHIFVGISKRTNQAGVDFLQEKFPHKKVHALHVKVTDDPKTNILHLDCTFQPVGDKYAIIFEDGFEKRPAIIYELFEEENLIKVTAEEMYSMFPNVVSISPTCVASEKHFTRLNEALKAKGIRVVEVAYNEVSKLSGLFRCSTMPLRRRY